MVARDGAGPKIARSVTSCAECLAWGWTYAQGVCLACYNFAARNPVTSDCAGCGRRLPLKKGYCRLCWCQARADRDALAATPGPPWCWLPGCRRSVITSCSSPGWTSAEPGPARCPGAAG